LTHSTVGADASNDDNFYPRVLRRTFLQYSLSDSSSKNIGEGVGIPPKNKEKDKPKCLILNKIKNTS